MILNETKINLLKNHKFIFKKSNAKYIVFTNKKIALILNDETKENALIKHLKNRDITEAEKIKGETPIIYIITIENKATLQSVKTLFKDNEIKHIQTKDLTFLKESKDKNQKLQINKKNCYLKVLEMASKGNAYTIKLTIKNDIYIKTNAQTRERYIKQELKQNGINFYILNHFIKDKCIYNNNKELPTRDFYIIVLRKHNKTMAQFISEKHNNNFIDIKSLNESEYKRYTKLYLDSLSLKNGIIKALTKYGFVKVERLQRQDTKKIGLLTNELFKGTNKPIYSKDTTKSVKK